MVPFMDLPSEILLLIISFLEIPSVLLFRQTCRTISQLTQDKGVWLDFLERLRKMGDIPLPSAACDPAVPVVELASSTVESIVVSVTRASESWLQPRELRPILNPIHGQPLTGLVIFLDTWLLIIYGDGLCYLWDIRDNAARQGYRATLDLRAPGIHWSSYSASLAPENKTIILAMSNTSPTFDTVLYEINIGTADSTGTTFNLVGSFPCPIPRTVHAIDVDSLHIVLSSSTRALDVIRWHQGDTFRITLDADIEDITVSPRYAFLVPIFSPSGHTPIELHPYGDATQPEPNIPPLKHPLPFPLREGAVSVSDALTTYTSVSNARHIKINVLAYDAHSLASYTISIVLPDAMALDEHPVMDVTLAGEVRPAPPQVHSGTPLTRSHWFVSTHAVGPQAIRAMWVERESLRMTRQLRLCTFNRNATWHDMKTAAHAFGLTSYDLREDLTHCALAEVSGHIVLGNRVGHVFLTKTRTPPRSD